MGNQTADETYSIFSNLHTFEQIAVENYRLCLEFFESNRTPKEGGGYVIKYDPDKKSFKHGLISIVFTGSFMDLYLSTCYFLMYEEYPSSKWCHFSYEKKLATLKVRDADFLRTVASFRDARNDVLHEQPVIFGHTSNSTLDQNYLTAQESASLGIEVLHGLKKALELVPA